jgi:hypothetical protein
MQRASMLQAADLQWSVAFAGNRLGPSKIERRTGEEATSEFPRIFAEAAAA